MEIVYYVACSLDGYIATVEGSVAWLVGGGGLAGSFSAQKLISEYRITVIPVLLGAGIRLFEGTTDTQTLSLVDSKRYSDGVVQLIHRPTETGA